MSANKNRILLFVDPGSKSTGWCFVRGTQIAEHGTINTEEKELDNRLFDIYSQYYDLGNVHGDPKGNHECHIERMNYRVHFAVQWSIGAIVCALRSWWFKCDADISPHAWQKSVNWKTDRKPLQKFLKKVQSEDELAAIGMALHWLSLEKGYKELAKETDNG